MARKCHFAVAYGHVVRWEHAESMTAAARLAFGMVDAGRMTVVEATKPRATSHKARVALETTLALRHFRKTGNVVSGYEKTPGIHNTHWTKCPLCHIPIITEPASCGEDDKVCAECESKYLSLSEEERESLSVSAIRERLGITKR